MMQCKHKRFLPPKGNQRYESNWRLWRIVNGAVADAFKMHPAYLAAPHGRASASEWSALSALQSFAGKPARGCPAKPAAEKEPQG